MDSIKSVLIIDDDEDDIFLIQERLNELVSSKVEYVTCNEKQTAVNYLKERTFGLCILDYRLTGFKGLDVLAEVAEAELATPIIMLTGQNDDEVAKQAIKLGAQDFIMKSLIDDKVFEKSIHYAAARKELWFARLLSQRNKAENIAKDKFIAHLSHELRTPLTSILGYTSLLLENEETEPFHNELGIISKNGKHLLNLLNDVLDLSKIAAGKFELKEQEVDLQQVLSEINSLVLVNALDKGLSLEFLSVNRLPRHIVLDDLRFKQVLLNLIGNAIKFTDKGGISVSFKFSKNVEQPTLEVRVIDTGIGMKASEKKKIFSPFKQIEDVADRKAGGAGLGLSISVEIVKQMKGELRVNSRFGEGSEFILSVPCQYSNDDLIDINFDVKQEPALKLAIPALQGRVLVVDDLFEIRQLAGFYVQQTGMHVDFAKHGEEALQMLSAEHEDAKGNTKKYDCVLMDLHMPVMTGKEAVVSIKKELPSLPVIAMTAAVSKGIKDELLNAGFVGLISKPIDKKELWKQISQVTSHSHKPTSAQGAIKQARQDSKSALIHLVEDDIDSAEVMQMMLERLGFGVVHSNTGEEALKNMGTANVLFHLIDLGLPDLSSEDLIKAITNTQYKGELFILSGEQPDDRLLQNYPIRDHLIKPLSMEDLRRVLCS